MLRDNRKFQFAVGVTAIVIVIRWLLTGDLLMAVEAARPPAEGETKSLTVLSVVGPMLIEACVIIGASLIAWALKLWDFVAVVVDRANHVRDSPDAGYVTVSASPKPTTATPLIQTVSQPEASRNALAPTATSNPAIELAKAVAAGDTESESALRKEIRKPYLRLELGECVKTANWERARGILDELESMDGVKPAASSKKRTNSAQSST